METGRIIGNVYTSRGKIPVKDATFLIRLPGMRDEIIALAVTDSSGQTQELFVPTLEVEKSTQPGEKVAYALVDVVVEHPEFVLQVLENVQVFPGIDTLLPVELQPLSEGGSSLVEESDISLSVQDL